MLCTISPGNGKQFHQYIPHLKQSIVSLKEPAKQKDVKEYFTKMYPKTDASLLDEISSEFTRLQKRKYYLSQLFPNLKIADIETLNEIITDEEIRKYESDRGN
jgi:alpha-acetolactate decarboxylase